MTLLTPADELRAAAHLIRRHADGVTPGPWKSEASVQYGHRVGAADNSAWVARTGDRDEEHSARDADWIALMHPVLGAALAEWLDGTAATVEAVSRKIPEGADERDHWLAPALAVARAVNGTAR
jgi:hypothetical protein